MSHPGDYVNCKICNPKKGVKKMKVEQKQPRKEFIPITITLESFVEAQSLYHLLEGHNLSILANEIHRDMRKIFEGKRRIG